MNYKKIIFYIGCILSLIMPLISFTKSYATGLSLIIGMILSSFSFIFIPKNLNKIRKLTLNTAVILFGFGLNISSIISIGGKGVIQTALSLVITLFSGFLLMKLLNLKNKSTELIIYGTSICGGSAIATISPVINAKDEDIAISTGIIFLLNTIALFLFAFFINTFNLNAEQTGIWTALSIHDTSSVVSAAAIHSNEALKIATIMKLTRTLWIIPIVIVLSFINKTDKKKISFPLFILFFILATIFSSTVKLPEIYKLLTLVGKMLLSLSLFFIGSSININTLKKLSTKSLLFGILLWICSIVSGYFIVMYL